MNTIKKALWKTKKPSQDLADNISELLQCHPLTAKLLVNRSVSSILEIKNFFSQNLKLITAPDKIKDIDKASQRILKALLENEKILIFGDYDADGVTSTSIVYLFLRKFTKNISYFIPDRGKDGYGFSIRHADMIRNNNINLIITVDCGSSDHEAINAAKKAGIDTIVTDHHKIPDIPVNASAVVNPHRKDCTSGLTHLAGVGVAFYLLIQLRKIMREYGFFREKPEPKLNEFLPLVAIGTIADVVPLIKENRIFARKGIMQLRSNPGKPLEELIKISKLNYKYLSSQDIAFSIAPRINSAGRLTHAKICADLFCSSNTAEIKSICSDLDELNTRRKKEEEIIVSAIEKKMSLQDLQSRILIFESEEWNPGILGTAASKITRKYNLPCILFNKNGSELKGSARSIPGFSIYDLIKNQNSYLKSFGGHTQAAGLSADFANYSVFCKKIKNEAYNTLTAEILTPVQEAEDVVIFDDLSTQFLNELELFEPFGELNPYPLFITKNLKVESSSKIGDIHSRVSLYQQNCFKQNRLNGFIFNNTENIPFHFNQILLKPVPDKFNRDKFNIFIEAWE
ncbi:MAG: single-stranded-DNA-specific exonuclease RecJ [Thermodesulfobacteriota bacterium]